MRCPNCGYISAVLKSEKFEDGHFMVCRCYKCGYSERVYKQWDA